MEMWWSSPSLEEVFSCAWTGAVNRRNNKKEEKNGRNNVKHFTIASLAGILPVDTSFTLQLLFIPCMNVAEAALFNTKEGFRNY